MVPVQDSVMTEYLGECNETLGRLNVQLGQLEKDGFSPELMRTIERDIHTIKGSSQLFGFNRIGEVAHHMEHCLRQQEGATGSALPELIESLFKGTTFIGQSFDSIRTQGVEPEYNDEVKATLKQLIELGESKSQQDVSEAPMPKAQASAEKAPSDDGRHDTIRVNVALLDNLINLIGELGLIRNQIIKNTKGTEDESNVEVSQRLNIVTSALQDQIMKTRMQPIGYIMTKFHRVVRDTAKHLGKLVEFSLEGAETELDKTLIEAVRDPLTHIIRNAIDHGIEMPKARIKAGKPETGTLSVRSYIENGHVIIEVADDGRGLDRERIVAKAIERGLTSPEQAARLSDHDVFQFVFVPGFSTAEKVSKISGRGVGMDVVKFNIERIGGTVVIETVLHQSTKIELKIPLTLAIIPALLVRANGSAFAIPQIKVVELLSMSRDDVKAGAIQCLEDHAVHHLRGQSLPLISLKDVLTQTNHSRELLGPRFQTPETVNIVVLNADGLNFGLSVDAIEGSADIVVKPIASVLKDLGIFSGATNMGDGSIALTLDVLGIANRAGAFTAPEATAGDLKELRHAV